MVKKNKNQMYVILGILIVGIIFLGPQLGLFQILGVSDDFKVKSNYIAKVGLIDDIIEESDADYGNLLIEKGYGFIILETPVEIDGNTQRYVDDFEEWNDQCLSMKERLQDSEFQCPFFSDNFINIFSKNSYSFSDMEIIKTEGEKSLNNACVFYIELYNFFGGGELQEIKEACENKPDEVIKRVGGKYVLNLNDVYVEGELIKLSGLRVEMWEVGDDIIIAVGDKGIEEAEKISAHENFIDYVSEIKHKDSKLILSGELEKGYFVVTNNDEVAEKSKIEKGDISDVIPDEPSKFDINNELFNLKGFSVTWLIVFIAMGGLILFSVIKK